MSQLEFAHVTKKYGDLEALSAFTLSVQKGELISIVGPSGCGKTTALRVAAGFEKFDAGRLIVNGQNVELVPPQKRNMGMVFQSYSLFPHLTVAENIGFGLTIRKMEKKKRASVVSDMLDLVQLVDVGHRFPHQLSGGQQQRVALARALAIEPTVLLLDEPLNALDAKVRIEVRDEIRSLQKRTGTTTLFVTHDQEEALTISDRVCVMSKGVIQQVGTPREVYDNPGTAFVATFIGETNSVVIGGKEVLVRPEHTRVVNDAEPDSYRGSVQSVSFAGPLKTVVVRMSVDESLVRATMTNTGGVDWTIGQEIGVIFDRLVPLK
ncbi:MAG: ABC transporter ATP-binding protein [Actinobacteria bacterium]|nr:ABC transporter ATP-binding protein [Actinomycetota bacterium]